MSKLKQTEGRELILARYESGPARLREAVAGLSKTSLDVALDVETWTIRQIVHHVVDGDDIWKTCIKMALGNGKATFDLQWYWTLPQTAWAERWAYADRAIEPSLTLFEANRRPRGPVDARNSHRMGSVAGNPVAAPRRARAGCGGLGDRDAVAPRDGPHRGHPQDPGNTPTLTSSLVVHRHPANPVLGKEDVP